MYCYYKKHETDPDSPDSRQLARPRAARVACLAGIRQLIVAISRQLAATLNKR
jgi:hypothetical protein